METLGDSMIADEHLVWEDPRGEARPAAPRPSTIFWPRAVGLKTS